MTSLSAAAAAVTARRREARLGHAGAVPAGGRGRAGDVAVRPRRARPPLAVLGLTRLGNNRTAVRLYQVSPRGGSDASRHRRHPDPAARGRPAPADTERPVRSITTGPRGYEGEGFPVVRAFAGVSAADLDPFVHMDQMGEVEYQPGEPRGTDWHPHRGFETVTYMIDGRFAHQDSHGGGGLITDGATQWMTAGSGILHIETPPAELVESGGTVPRPPAVGEPAQERTSSRRRGTRPSRVARSSCCPRTTAARWSASSPARSTATGPRRDVYADHVGACHH